MENDCAAPLPVRPPNPDCNPLPPVTPASTSYTDILNKIPFPLSQRGDLAKPLGSPSWVLSHGGDTAGEVQSQAARCCRSPAISGSEAATCAGIDSDPCGVFERNLQNGALKAPRLQPSKQAVKEQYHNYECASKQFRCHFLASLSRLLIRPTWPDHNRF